ncbi:pectate lyase [Paenibacillus tarimensis]
MKKGFAVLLSLMMLFSLVQIVSYSVKAEASAAYLINDDFETETAGTVPAGYMPSSSVSGATAETSAVFVDNVPAESIGNGSAKALRVFDNDGAEANRSRTIVTKTFEPQTGSFVVEFDMMEPKAVGNSYLMRLEDKASKKYGVLLEVSGGNIGYRASDGTWKAFTDQGGNIPLAANTWYHVRMLVDILNDAADIYINGKYMGNIPFHHAVDSLNAVEAQTAGSSVGDLYWDNVQVYVEATDSPKSLTAVFGDQMVQLSWTAAKGASYYQIKRSTEDGGPYEAVASDVTETRYLDTGLMNDTTYYYVVTAVNAVGESQPSNQVAVTPTVIPNPPGSPSALTANPRNSQADLSWNPPGFGEGKSILYVGAGLEADQITMDHLKALGFNVSFVEDRNSAAGDAEGHDLVFIGESSSSSRIAAKFKNAAAPVVYAEPFALDDVGLSSANGGDFGTLENQTSVAIQDSAHPLAAGLSGTVAVYTQPGNLNYGTPGEEAVIIATAVGDDSKAVIFGYEQGAKNVNGETVPARRVSTFLFAGQEAVMTPEGWSLIDAAVKWAAGLEETTVAPVDYYRVKRSTQPEGPYETVAEAEGTEYRDFGLDNGVTYYYKITSVNIGGESEPSAAASVTPAAPLDAPSGLTARSGDNQVTISWNPVAGAEAYDVKRSTVDGRSYEVIARGVTESQFTDTAVVNGVRYYYVVSASSQATASTNSASVQAVPAPVNGAPAIPAGIEAAAGYAQVILTWPEISGAESYTIKRGIFNSGAYETVASGVRGTTYQDGGLENGVTYDYVITAVNASGESYPSEPVAVTPADVVVVAKDGSGDFTTVQAAVDAAPDHSAKRHVIFIKNGEYREKLTIPDSKTNLSFVGESKEETVLVYNDNANTLGPDGNPLGTSRSSSVFIYANDFIAKNLTIQNDSGQGTGQAVAANIRGDRAYFENVRFLGYQDTLLTNGGRHYYKACYIEGDVDFIFGPSTAVFDHCQINSKRNGGMLTAASTPQDQPYGYVFLNSEITSDEGIENVYFGRPWRPYAAVSFINTTIDSSIAPYGWDNWRNPENEKTARYSEYNSRGPGANPKARAGWTKQLTPEEANQYTVQNVLKGNDNWNPLRVGIIPLTAASAPVLTVDQQDAIVNKPAFTVSGKVDKEAAVTVNDTNIEVAADLTFSTTVELEPGENTITVQASDAEGHMAIPVHLRVIYDNVVPVIELSGPEGENRGDYYITIYNPYPVSGKLSEAGKVWVGGKEVNVSEDLTFSTEIGLSAEINQITITAEDRAGNSANPVTFNVIPKGNSVPPGPVQIVDAALKDAQTIEVTLNSKLNVFDASDFQLLSAMGNWESLNPNLTPNLTVTEVSTRVNKSGQTVAVFNIVETLNPDATFNREAEENPRNIPFLKPGYYSSDTANNIKQADYLLSWQLDNGGWFKNMQEKYSRPWDGMEAKSDWYSKEHGYIGTIDNNATTNEILFLAVMYKETGDERYKESVLRGIDYLLESQYPSGGWPQAYPSRGGYADYATFNDNAMIRVMNVLKLVTKKQYPFNTDLVSEALVQRTADALELGLDYILKSQIKVNGVLTAWCAQHDPVTYEPREARAYEHPSISGSESIGIIKYLMALPNPSAEVQAAIDGALKWFDEVKLEGVNYVSGDPAGKYFYDDPSSTTWYRFYEIGTNLPIFSGRDGIIKHNILEIEQERRDGYRWAGDWAKKLLEVAGTTGYFEDRIYVKVVGSNSGNAAGETLEIGELKRIEAR